MILRLKVVNRHLRKRIDVLERENRLLDQQQLFPAEAGRAVQRVVDSIRFIFTLGRRTNDDS